MEHPENSDAYKGLTVNQGIEQPAAVNPYLKARKRPKRRCRRYPKRRYYSTKPSGHVGRKREA